VHKIDSRIDSEISQVKAILEAFKAETVRYVAGILEYKIFFSKYIISIYSKSKRFFVY
jgi:hypothetical protein